MSPAQAFQLQSSFGNAFVQRRVASQAPAASNAPGGAFSAATRGGGGEVPYRAEMESAFGQDFSDVQAHSGQPEALGALGAAGAASGETVAFAATSPSRETVAHELTHVVQAREQRVPGGQGVLEQPSLESEARANGARVAAGGEVATTAGGPVGASAVQLAGGAPRVVAGAGGYTYKQFPDGTIEIVSGPTGAGTKIPPGSPINVAITAEIGPYPSTEEGAEEGGSEEESKRRPWEIPASLAVGDLSEIQPQVDALTAKAKAGEDFTDEEKDFLSDLYWWIGAGGWVKGLPEASALQRQYVNGEGEALEIDSEVYETSTIVQYAMAEMKKVIAQDLQTAGQVRNGGNVSSTDVLQPTNMGDQQRLGEIIKGGYLLAEQGNRRLKYANNRFALGSFTEEKEGFWPWQDDSWIETTWRVDDVWDFGSFPEQKEKGRNDVTHIPLPGGAVLKLHDGLSHYMTEQGIAAEFEYWAEWTERWHLEAKE